MDRIDVRTGRPGVRRSGLPITWITSRPATARRLGLRRADGVRPMTWTREPATTPVATKAG